MARMCALYKSVPKVRVRPENTVGVAHYPKWSRDVGWEQNDRFGSMHTSDHHTRAVWYGFTRSSEEEEEEGEGEGEDEDEDEDEEEEEEEECRVKHRFSDAMRSDAFFLRHAGA